MNAPMQIAPKEVEYKSKQFHFKDDVCLNGEDNLKGSEALGEWLSDQARGGWMPRTINEYVIEGDVLLVSVVLLRQRESSIAVANAVPPTIYEPRTR